MRIRDAAHWGSWADCLEMVRAAILKWPRTSSEECKEECPIVCPQSRIAQHISKTLECSCQHGKHWQEPATRLDQRDAQRFGHLTSAEFRRSTFGGRGGGAHIIRRMPVCTRRNTCLSTPRGRHTQARPTSLMGPLWVRPGRTR